jgi:hypothetical protein
MATAGNPPAERRETQFTLAALFEYVTLCAILAALSPLVGVASGVFLMLMALALIARQGWLALAMLMAASLAADWPYLPHAESSFGRQFFVLLLGGGLAGWRHLRRSSRSGESASRKFNSRESAEQA